MNKQGFISGINGNTYVLKFDILWKPSLLIKDTVPKPNTEDPWESEEEGDDDDEVDDEAEDTEQVHIPPQSSQGNQLKEEVEQAYQKLVEKKCCPKQCLSKIDVEDIYRHILELRSHPAKHREALVMGLLIARRYRNVL